MNKQSLSILAFVFVFGVFTRCDTMNSKSKGKSVIDENFNRKARITSRLSAADDYDVRTPIVIRFTVENSASDTIKFTKYNTPFEGFLGDFLEIKNDKGDKMNYIGPMAKRVMPPPADAFVVVPPNEKKWVDIDIKQGYKIDNTGNYILKFLGDEINGLSSGEPIKISLKDQLNAAAPITLIIMLSEDTPLEKIINSAKMYGATVIYRYETLHGLAISLPNHIKSEDAIAYFQKLSGVLNVEKDQLKAIQK